MILESSVYKEIFGPLIVHESQKVIKFDTETEKVESSLISNIPREEIYNIFKDLAIVIPLKNEKLHLLDGVLKAIPHKCPIIVVSASQKDIPNHFKMEIELIKHYYSLTHSKVLIIHQKDLGASEAFKEQQYFDIIDEKDGLIRLGKGEGMLLGVMLAKSIGAKYVGFIDADNYIPGSVNEYVKDYAAGILMSESEYTMVRLKWRHKPKVMQRGLYFRRRGRVSEITNKYLNLMVADRTGFETDIFVTGNAGEHAMSMQLANIMSFSSGYSVETHQLVFLLDKMTNPLQSEKYKDIHEQGIEIFQIETLNPHIHEEKGTEHINEMILVSLAEIYHCSLCSENVKRKILEELYARKILNRGEVPPKPSSMSPIGDLDIKKWFRTVKKKSDTLVILE